MKLVVSIHDVAPPLLAEVDALWRLCAARAVTPALLIVPNWHGAWPIEEYPNFTAWVKARVEAGAEIFLHGLRHDEAGLPRMPADALRAFGRTAREGEFLTLDYASARHRIQTGLRRLRSVGLDPVGFVAPAWLSRADCQRAVTDAGLAFSEDDSRVVLHGRASSVESPVIRWSARTAWRAHASDVVARFRAVTLDDHPTVRVALHPMDLRHPATSRSIGWTLDRLTERRRHFRYSEL